MLLNCLKCVSIFTALYFSSGAVAGELDPLEACGALAASLEQESSIDEEMIRKLSDGYSLAQVVDKCNQNNDLCRSIQRDLTKRKMAVPKGLTCSK